MSKRQNNVTEVAQQILQTLRAGDLLSLSGENDTAVLESLSAILVYAGFPERDALEKKYHHSTFRYSRLLRHR
jgi:hypothetical protein